MIKNIDLGQIDFSSIKDKELILIDKPKGITSFDVIRILRKGTGIRKMGHAGTLDPLATGLMLIGINKGTKKLSSLIGFDKVYYAEILLGVETDSGDSDGHIVSVKPVSKIDKEIMEKVFTSMIGEIDLPVSLYSAIKKDGKPLYEYARTGAQIEKPIKKMKVISATFLNFDVDKNIIKAEFNVGSGTYIRSLAEEIARRLKTCGHIINLRRLSIGDFKVSDSLNRLDN